MTATFTQLKDASVYKALTDATLAQGARAAVVGR